MNAIKKFFTTSGNKNRFRLLDKVASVEIVVILYTLAIFFFFQTQMFELQQTENQGGAKGYSYPSSLKTKWY